MRHRTGLRIAACLTALFLVTVVASPSYASTACQRRALWEQDFDFIDRITLACTGLTEAAGIIAGLYVPYPALVTAVGGPWATKMLGYAAAYGINLKSIGLDKRYACRVVRTALAARHQPSHTGAPKPRQLRAVPPGRRRVQGPAESGNLPALPAAGRTLQRNLTVLSVRRGRAAS